jgi:hypothetical protein
VQSIHTLIGLRALNEKIKVNYLLDFTDPEGETREPNAISRVESRSRDLL